MVKMLRRRKPVVQLEAREFIKRTLVPVPADVLYPMRLFAPVQEVWQRSTVTPTQLVLKDQFCPVLVLADMTAEMRVHSVQFAPRMMVFVPVFRVTVLRA
jgi:hypothetical protein